MPFGLRPDDHITIGCRGRRGAPQTALTGELSR